MPDSFAIVIYRMLEKVKTPMESRSPLNTSINRAVTSPVVTCSNCKEAVSKKLLFSWPGGSDGDVPEIMSLLVSRIIRAVGR